MAMNSISTAARDAMCNALVDLLDEGTDGPIIEIYTAAFATKLAVLIMDGTAAFGNSATGVATAATINDEDSAVNTGAAAVCRISSSDAADTVKNTHFEGTVGTSGADINFNTVSIVTGDTVSISSMTVTQPAA